MRISKKLTALGALVVLAVGVAGCGSSIPSNSVASVAGNSITLSAFNHWMYVYAKEEASQEESTTVINPISPPDFETCLQQIQDQIPSLKKESKTTLKTDCGKLFTQYKTAVMNFLIEAYWYQLQGHKAGITVTDADVQKQLAAEQKKAGSEFATELKASGETQADLEWQIRVNQIYMKLVAKEKKPIDAASIAAYYKAHMSTYGTPATATAHIVKVSSQADAEAAYNELKSGTSWDDVAEKYASTAAGKKNGGLTTVTTGSQEQAVVKAVTTAPLNTVIAPVHGTFGWYVIEVTKRTAATQQSLAKATPQIKQALLTANAQAAATAVLNSAKSAWKSETKCVDAYSVPYCTGYVAPKTTTTAASTTPASTATTGSTTATSTATSTGTATSTTSTGTGTSTTGG